MNTSEDTRVHTERCARSLAGVPVDLASVITIIIPGSFVGAGAYGDVGRMAAAIALPRIRVED